ncbi:MAG: hypothetical protein NTZ13_05215 [Candidatus Parcubacteria bacterium]|nr:hypothetical protein [Candidatus Parcubacteria bacterium]
MEKISEEIRKLEKEIEEKTKPIEDLKNELLQKKRKLLKEYPKVKFKNLRPGQKFRLLHEGSPLSMKAYIPEKSMKQMGLYHEVSWPNTSPDTVVLEGEDIGRIIQTYSDIVALIE